MGGLCGWIGANDQSGDARSDLAAMSSYIGEMVREPALPCSRTAALAAGCGPRPVSVYRSDTLCVAVEGQVVWSSIDAANQARTNGDAATLADLYRVHGADCLRHASGPFAVAIVDLSTCSGLIAIDRMGIRTMSYAIRPGQVVFGSSAESVAAHPHVGRTIAEQSVFNFLYFHVVPSPGTIFRSVSKLQPGQCLVVKNGVATVQFYWQLQYPSGHAPPVNALEARFRDLLRTATRRAMGDSREIGAFLSGGTDSSTVAGLLTELRAKKVDTFSIGFAAEGFDEMEYARITSRHFGTRAHEYYVTPDDVISTIPVIASGYDEPFGNASAVPTYLCARMAHDDGVRVMLAGDGGDEIFGGNARYAKQKIFEAYSKVPGPLRRAMIEPALSLSLAGRVPLLAKARSYVTQAVVPLPDRLETYNFLHRAPLADIFEEDFLASIDPEEPLRLLRGEYHRSNATSPIDRMMYLDLKFTLADNDLRKVSRMSELAGVEARYPLIDEELVAFSTELAPSLKVNGLRLRYFFKHALKEFLPPATISKTKHGFGMPFGIWMKQHKPLADMAHDSLRDFQRRRIIKPEFIASLITHHEAEHSTYFGVLIWVVMVLEQWLRARRL